MTFSINNLQILLQIFCLFQVWQQEQDDGGGGIGSVAPPPSAKITLNGAVESRIRSLPFVSQVIPSYQGDISIQSGSESKSFSVLSMDPSQLFVISPTLELNGGLNHSIGK